MELVVGWRKRCFDIGVGRDLRGKRLNALSLAFDV